MTKDTIFIAGTPLPVSPVEDAFTEGELVASVSRPDTSSAMERSWSDSMLNSALVVVLALLSIIFLRNILGALPPLIKSLTRSRGAFNLESSVRAMKDRNILATLLALPFAMVMSCYRVWNPSFAVPLSDEMHLLVTAGALLAFYLLRRFLCARLYTRRINFDYYNIANRFAYTYFIVIATAVLISAGIMSVTDCDPVIIRKVLLWISALLFGVFIFRKFNIFNSFCSPFISFLYLCGLEIIPMGLLVSTAVFF